MAFNGAFGEHFGFMKITERAVAHFIPQLTLIHRAQRADWRGRGAVQPQFSPLVIIAISIFAPRAGG